MKYVAGFSMWDFLLKGVVWGSHLKNMPDKFLAFAWKYSPAEFRTSKMLSLQIYWEKKKKKEDCTYHALKSWIKGLHTIFQLLMVADCKIFFSILTCLCLKICKGHSRDWQSARENGVSQILAPIAWVMLPSFMFQVSFEHVSNPDYSSLTHRCTTCLAGGRGVQWQTGSLLGPAATPQQLQAYHRLSTGDKNTGYWCSADEKQKQIALRGLNFFHMPCVRG